MRALPLEEHGVVWRHPEVPLAHPLDGTAAVLHRSIEATASRLGDDGDVWRRLVGPLVDGGLPVLDDFLSPLTLPHHPLQLARFARFGLRGADRAATHLHTSEARGLLAGLAAHSVLPLERWMSAGVGLMLAAYAHVVGWPVAEGGARRSPTRWSPSSAPTAATSCAITRSPTSTSCRPTPSCSPTCRHRRSSRWPATGCRPGPAGGGPGSAGARGPSSSTTPCRGPSRGPTRTSPAPARSTSGARSRRSRPARRRRPRRAHGQAVRARRPALGVRPDRVPRTAGTRCGPTATCPEVRTST